MVQGIYNSREKDYTNPFRLMVYDGPEEMSNVVGNLDENPFIQLEQNSLGKYKRTVSWIIKKLDI